MLLDNEPDAMSTDFMNPQPYGGLNPTGAVSCARCSRSLAYDTGTSRWFDDTGLPGCAPSADGAHMLEHDSVWSLEDDDSP